MKDWVKKTVTTKNKRMIFIFRFLSAIMTLCIVVPLYLVTLIADAIFKIFNGFTYHNFISTDVPFEMLEKAKINIQYYGFVKIWILLISPIIEIPFKFYQGLKSIKF